MSISNLLMLVALIGLIILVLLFWWSRSWPLESRRKFYLLWPIVCPAVLLESISIVGIPLVYPPHWPIVSLGIVLTAAWLSRFMKPRAKFWVRAMSFGLSFGAAPSMYWLISPAVLVPFLWWRDIDDNFKERAGAVTYVVIVVAFYTLIAAIYLHFIKSKIVNKPSE